MSEPLITSWTDANGVLHTVRTARGGGEEHRAAVEFFKTVFPPAS